jgi:CzcA family heavy metal efflux pump
MRSAEGTEREQQGLLWILKRRSTVIFLCGLAALTGIYFATKIPISVFPDTNFPRVVIGIDNGVMPVEQMQVTITKPVEDAVNTVPGLETVRSTTSRGTAEVSLFFSWDVDMFRTLQLVDAALSRVRQQLPPTAIITTNRLTFATFPILGYSLTSDRVPLSQLWEIATYDLKPPINRLPGVSAVGVQGDQIPDFEIVPDVGRMQNAGVTIADIQNAVQSTNSVDSPGLVRNRQQLVLALVGGQVHNPEELGKIVVKNTASGVPVAVSDVATVRRAVEPTYTMIRAQGKEAVLLNITRQPTSNTVQVADEVAAEIDRLRPALPPGITIQPFYDQSHLVRESIKSVRDAILIGLILATLIIVVFLRDWRSSLVAALVIPATVSITFILLYVLGESFNLMTLGGLAAAVGLVIDDAIVVVENIVLHRAEGQRRGEAIRLALREIATPLIGSTITPIVVFLPLIWVSGVTGSFFRALAVTMTASLLVSLLLAVTWTPALSYLLLREPKNSPGGMTHESHAESGVMLWVLDFYERWLRRGLARPIVLFALCGVLLGGAFLGYRALGSDLLPEMDEGGFILDYIMPAGTSLQETDRVLSHVEQILKQTPEVKTISRRTGAQMGLAAVTEANTGDITVKLKDNRVRGIDEVISEVRGKINQTEPQMDVEFTQVLQDMIGDLSNAPEPIQIKLFNNNPEILADVADRVAETIKQQPGVVDVENGIENTVSGPSDTFQVNANTASRLGFTVPEVTTDAAAVVEGVQLTTPMIQNGRSYDIRIRYPEASRSSVDAMESSVLVGSGGHLATLGSIASLKENPGEQEILRENLQRDVVVTGRLEGADLGTAVANVQQRVAALHLPPTVHVFYGGTYAEQQKSFSELTRVLLVALLLVFGVLLAEFGNFSAPLAILTSSVLSVAGVVFGLLVTRTTFNVASFVGLIMVIGIVAKNGILLLDAEQRNAASYGTLLDSVVHAGRRRLRPILMTALAAVTGMLPLALAIGAGSQMLQPLAIAVIGGLILSLGLSLVMTPAVFYLLNKRHRQARPAFAYMENRDEICN